MSKTKNASTASTHWLVTIDDGRVVILFGDGDMPVIADLSKARRISMGVDEAKEFTSAMRKATGAL